ncbi:MAG: Fic family protein [Gammaproteobacteria bacterium]
MYSRMPPPNDDMQKLIANNEAHLISARNKQDALSEFESHYPPQERWRLLVDGRMHQPEQGWMAYENRENGAIEAFCSASIYCIRKLYSTPERQPLTIAFIKKLHFLVTDNVRRGGSGFFGGKFRTSHSQSFTLGNEPWRLTKPGIADLLNSLKQYHADVLFADENNYFLYNSNLKIFMKGKIPPNPLDKDLLFFKVIDQNGAPIIENIKSSYRNISIPIILKNHNLTMDALTPGFYMASEHEIFRLTSASSLSDLPENIPLITKKIMDKEGVLYLATPHDKIEELVAKTLEHYNQAITSTQSDEEKLVLIGKTIESLERIHPFYDANGRVFVNLLLNYLLVEEGFPLATLFEPNVFDAFGYHADVLARGILNTQAIYNGEEKLFGFSSNEAEPSAIQFLKTAMERGMLRDLSTYLTDLLDEVQTQAGIHATSSHTLIPVPVFNEQLFIHILSDGRYAAVCSNHLDHPDIEKINKHLGAIKIISKNQTLVDACNDFLQALEKKSAAP